MSNFKLVLCLLTITGTNVADPETVYLKKESSIIFECPYKNTSKTHVTWFFVNNTVNPVLISDGPYIIPSKASRPRVSIVGNHAAGVFNLQMSRLQDSDEGVYRCIVGVKQKENKLEFIAVPSSLTLQDVTAGNMIRGKEGHSLTLICSASGGKPPPLVTISVDNIVRSADQVAEYRISTLLRGHDRQRIDCQANNTALTSPLATNAILYLYLKPSQPNFSSDLVSTEETIPLAVSCTSTGSRPAATFQWTLGLTNITSYSTTQIVQTPDDTYTVTSTLTYVIDRTRNGQTITCTAVNIASGYGVKASKILDVKFAPIITVANVSYSQFVATRTVTCNPIGNPTSYTYYRWQHKSTNGSLIREFGGAQILTLPSVPVEARYNDSGEYVCIAGNGITGRDGKIQQIGSGYFIVNSMIVNDEGLGTEDIIGKAVGAVGGVLLIIIIVILYRKYRYSNKEVLMCLRKTQEHEDYELEDRSIS